MTRKGGRDYWYWKDKPVMECGAAKDVLTAAGLNIEGITSRGKDDPPDCEALVDGERSGIEVTELVHRKALELSIRGDEKFFAWEKLDLCDALQALIARKDRADVKGGPYKRYILVIHTDEMSLVRDTVERFLAGASFQAQFITDAFLGLSHEKGGCPVFKLALQSQK